MSGTFVETGHVEECPHIGPICDARDEPPQRHEQSILLSELRLSAEYPFAEGFSAQVVAPLRLVRTDIAFTDLEGRTLQLDYENIHHRDETLVGPGDPWLLVRLARLVGPFVLDLRAGVSLPVGRTEADPFEAEHEGEAHQHVQFGTGTIDPVFGLGFRREAGHFSIGYWAIGKLALYENANGYRAGNRFAAGLQGSASLGLRDWRFLLGLEGQAETAERWGGEVHGSDGSRGRFDLLAAAGASWSFAQAWSLTAAAKVPLVTEVAGAQLEYPVVGELGVTWVIETGGHDHDHDHDHGHAEGGGEADWTGLDMRHVAPNGEAVDLRPVAGKITVFDFWASWCVPCRELDRRIADLMRRNPGRVAVRKLRVEDWDTPAARRYLSEAPALPHVIVHGADGRREFQQSGDPARIVAAIERLLGE